MTGIRRNPGPQNPGPREAGHQNLGPQEAGLREASDGMNIGGTGNRLEQNSRERGSGTILAAGLALVVMAAMAVVLLLAQSAVLASRAAAAADLAALAGADALRGITQGEPCTIAAEVAGRHAAALLSCAEGPGQTLEVRTELEERSVLGPATGRARAGPPP